MLTTLRQRLQKDEDGFTLIELMVVVLIIGILLAIAIPNFLGAQGGAKDKAAQSDIRNAMTAVRALATEDGGSLAGLDQTEGTPAVPRIANDEPSLTWATTADGKGTITFDYVAGDATATPPVSGTAVVYTASGNDGNWFGAATNEDGRTVFCDAKSAGAIDTFAECLTNES